MFDGIRRRLGLHVHEWEVVDSQVVEIEQAVRQPLNPTDPQRGAGYSPGPPLVDVPVEILTFKCKTCGKVTESRSGA